MLVVGADSGTGGKSRNDCKPDEPEGTDTQDAQVACLMSCCGDQSCHGAQPHDCLVPLPATLAHLTTGVIAAAPSDRLDG